MRIVGIFHLNVPVRTLHYNPNLFVWNVSWIICIKFDKGCVSFTSKFWTRQLDVDMMVWSSYPWGLRDNTVWGCKMAIGKWKVYEMCKSRQPWGWLDEAQMETTSPRNFDGSCLRKILLHVHQISLYQGLFHLNSFLLLNYAQLFHLLVCYISYGSGVQDSQSGLVPITVRWKLHSNCPTVSHDRREPAVSYRWTSWVWEITGWSWRLEEDYWSL